VWLQGKVGAAILRPVDFSFRDFILESDTELSAFHFFPAGLFTLLGFIDDFNITNLKKPVCLV
jgi:hypothetical protein